MYTYIGAPRTRQHAVPTLPPNENKRSDSDALHVPQVTTRFKLHRTTDCDGRKAQQIALIQRLPSVVAVSTQCATHASFRVTVRRTSELARTAQRTTNFWLDAYRGRHTTCQAAFALQSNELRSRWVPTARSLALWGTLASRAKREPKPRKSPIQSPRTSSAEPACRGYCAPWR